MLPRVKNLRPDHAINASMWGGCPQCPKRRMADGGQSHCGCRDPSAHACTYTNTHYRHTHTSMHTYVLTFTTHMHKYHPCVHTTQVHIYVHTHHNTTHMRHIHMPSTQPSAIRAIKAQCQLGSPFGPLCSHNDILNGRGEQSRPRRVGTMALHTKVKFHSPS